MLIFDAPTREYCVVRRPRTNTPLQALVTLNDPHFVDAARGLAHRLMEESADPDKRIQRAFRLALGRAAQSDEMKILRETYNQQLAEFQNDPAAAEKLSASTGPEKTELAAWTTIASMIMNLDEFLTKG
jgi:hypothetical protein